MNKEDLKKIGKGALIVVCASLLAYAAELLPTIEFGNYTYLVVSVVSILINAGRKAIAGK